MFMKETGNRYIQYTFKWLDKNGQWKLKKRHQNWVTFDVKIRSIVSFRHKEHLDYNYLVPST